MGKHMTTEGKFVYTGVVWKGQCLGFTSAIAQTPQRGLYRGALLGY